MGGQDAFKGLTGITPCTSTDTLQDLQLTDLRQSTGDVTRHSEETLCKKTSSKDVLLLDQCFGHL